MENPAQSSQFIEKFPSNGDINQKIHHEDEPMDITENSDFITDPDSFLNMVLIKFFY